MIKIWMFEPSFTNKFKKDYKRVMKRDYDMKLFEDVYDLLCETGLLPSKYKPHKLTGNWKGFSECHIEPDWLLIYQVNSQKK